MKLSKLQRRILELALAKYDEPPRFQSRWGDPTKETYDSRNVLLMDAVKEIYGITCWRNVDRPWSGVFMHDEHCPCERCTEQRPDVRRRYNAAWTALLRSAWSLQDSGLVELGWFAFHRGVRLRLTDVGVTVARELLSKRPHDPLLNNQPPTVTRCACGALLDAQRSTRRYCSAACRQTAYRVRRAQTVALVTP